MNLREDWLADEIVALNSSDRCEACKHLMIFHHKETIWFVSYCDIGDCWCENDLGKWFVPKVEDD
jgi:hypothetical protein